MDVRLPDGTVVKNVPDNISKADLTAKLQKSGMAVPADWLPQKSDPAPEPESATSAKNLIGAATEPLLTLGSGSLATIASGLAGIGSSIPYGLGITQTQPGDVVRQVGQAMTYEPRTTGGKNAMKAIGLPGELIGQQAEKAGARSQQAFESAARFADKASPRVGDVVRGFGRNAATEIETVGKAVPTLFGGRALGRGAQMLDQNVPTVGNLVRRATGQAERPRVDPAARELANRGVTMTPGDIKGGLVRGLEGKATSIPVIGDIIRAAQARSVPQFQRATLDAALQRIGQRLPPRITGHDAVRTAGERIDAAYNQILPRMRGSLDQGHLGSTIPQNQTFRGEIEGIRQMAAQGLLPAQAATVGRIIDQQIIAKFTSQGRASGRTLQEIREQLRNEATEYRRSNVPDDRKVALAVQEMQASMDRMILRENPAQATQYRAIQDAYAQFKIAEDAAGMIGAREGVPTASQYRSQVRAHDTSRNKRRFARGTARNQPLAEAAQRALGDRYPDSGTAGRAALWQGLAALGGGGAGALTAHPLAMAAAGAVPLLYSEPVLNALQPLLLGDVRLAPGAATALPVGVLQNEQTEGGGSQ